MGGVSETPGLREGWPPETAPALLFRGDGKNFPVPGNPKGTLTAPTGVRIRVRTNYLTFRESGIIDQAGESMPERDTALLLVEIVAETFPVVFVFVAVDAEIFPVGAVCGVIPGIPVLVVHR